MDRHFFYDFFLKKKHFLTEYSLIYLSISFEANYIIKAYNNISYNLVTFRYGFFH